MPAKAEQFIKLPDVKAKTSLSKTKIYALIKDEHEDFPAPIKLGRSSVWLMSEVQDWMDKQVAASRGQEVA